MKILSYNVSWKSMTGNSTSKICNNNTNPSDDKYYMNCINNIGIVIDNNSPYDFILLQEASNHKKIIKSSECLQNMSYHTHKSGPERMTTFWNKKHKLDYVIEGEFVSGRPYHILIFNNLSC